MNASNPPSRRLVRCPRCQKQTEYSPDNLFRPFCSERCQLIDLGEWADENFKIPDPQGLSGAVNENSEPDEEIH